MVTMLVIEYFVCVLQHIRNLEDLGGIAKLTCFTQHGINFIAEVRTWNTTQTEERTVRLIFFYL